MKKSGKATNTFVQNIKKLSKTQNILTKTFKMVQLNCKRGGNAMEINSYECVFEQKAEGKYLFYKISLVSLYVIYTLLYFLIIFVTRLIPLGALIPLTLWIIIYFTWKYTSPAYKYAINSGVLTFSVIYGKKEKKIFETRVSETLKIAKAESFDQAAKGYEKVYSAVPKKNENDTYGMLFKKNTKLYIFYFKATRDALKVLHYYNKNTEI
jgi:hypothetical protein